MKKTHNTAGQKRAMVTRGRKGKDRNDTSNWEMPKNAAGDLVNSFWGYISPNGFRKPTPGAGVLRAMQRRVAEQANREAGLSTERRFLKIEAIA